MIFTRNPLNPILKPEPAHDWESYAAFNGSIIKTDEGYSMCYRAMGEEIMYSGKKLRLSTIGIATSKDAVTFENRSLFIKPEEPWELFGCEDPRVVHIDGKYLIFYTAIGNWPPNASGIRVAVAISDDMKTIRERHLVTPFNAKAMAMFPEKIDGKYTVILTANTDIPPSYAAIAQFENFETLWDEEFWDKWCHDLKTHSINLRRINSDQVEIGAAPVKTPQGWVLIHSYIKHYTSDNVQKEFRIEGALLDLQDPKHIIGRIEKVLLSPEAPYELEGQINHVVFPESALIENGKIHIYYGAADSYCAVASADLSEFMSRFEIGTPTTIKCEKFSYNPILKPIQEHKWESKAVYNPAAIQLGETTYIVYRTMSEDNQSYLGLAISSDGYHIDERLPEMIYPLRSEYELPKRPGQYAGVEDPRLTRIDDTIYIMYTAFNGDLPRLAMSSISVQNFLDRKWDTWTHPVIISPPNIADKDGILFPEKINGRYVFLHRIEPDIIIAETDHLDFEHGEFLGSIGKITPQKGTWDAVKIGVNGPPIKTNEGWIVFYHGISQIDRHYRLGVFLLDLYDVTHVIARAPYPVLEPEMYFEREGIVNNVVFPCGQVVKGDTIILYYGGADKVVCGATLSITKILDYLNRSLTKKYLVAP